MTLSRYSSNLMISTAVTGQYHRRRLRRPPPPRRCPSCVVFFTLTLPACRLPPSSWQPGCTAPLATRPLATHSHSSGPENSHVTCGSRARCPVSTTHQVLRSMPGIDHVGGHVADGRGSRDKTLPTNELCAQHTPTQVATMHGTYLFGVWMS